MTKSSLRALAALAVAALAVVAVPPAAAATLTYNDPSCAGFQITGSGGSFTLTCAKLACTISGNTAPTTTQDPTLTAACTPTGGVATGPVTYVWTLVSGPFSDPTCNGPQSPTNPITVIPRPTGIAAGQSRSCLYQVTGTAPSLSGQAMATVTWSDAPPTPPTCSALTATTNPAIMTNAGGTVTVDSHCTAAAGLTIYYTWQRTAAPANAGAFTASSGASQGDALAANANASSVTYTYQLRACTTPTAAAGTCASTQTIDVLVPGTGGGGGGVDCSAQGFTKTILVDIPWSTATPAQFQTQNLGGMTPNTAIVVRLGAAPAGTVLNNYGHITAAEFGDVLTSRTAVVSTQACDWTNTVGSPWYLQQASTVDWGLTVGATANYGYHDLRMQAGQTYYINIMNTDHNNANLCYPSATCNMVVNWIKPF